MDIKKYIYSHCVSPVRTWVYDVLKKQKVMRFVPCGKCLHCRNTYINEWVTRLFAQYNDSKYCYFVSLDYKPFDTSSTALMLAEETAACMHNINYHHTYGLHPLVLNKSHLQNFFKRLRKNTGIKFQYFACGEYGTHANGKGFGRPHFHMVVFSNEPISKQHFIDAWTLNGYTIGRLDYDDMKAFTIDEKNLLKSFKYVCKYIIKQNFDFEKLATINFHRAYYKSLQLALVKNEIPFPETIANCNEHFSEQTWREYIKNFSPFIVCSRRPSIGSAYFERNKERFAQGDFTLFGLSKECVAFPNYYVRKTKECLCPLVVVSQTNGKPTTSSRLSYVTSLLRAIQDKSLSFSNTSDFVGFTWRKDKLINSSVCPQDERLLLNQFHVYDNANCILYQFNGYYYTLWQKVKKLGFVRLGTMGLYDACDIFDAHFAPYYKKYVMPFSVRRAISDRELDETICKTYLGDTNEEKYAAFYKDVNSYYEAELAQLYKKNKYMQNSKINF